MGEDEILWLPNLYYVLAGFSFYNFALYETTIPYTNLDIDCFVFFFQAEDGIRDIGVTGVQTCALPICRLGSRHRAFLLPGQPPAAVGLPKPHEIATDEMKLLRLADIVDGGEDSGRSVGWVVVPGYRHRPPSKAFTGGLVEPGDPRLELRERRQ